MDTLKNADKPARSVSRRVEMTRVFCNTRALQTGVLVQSRSTPPSVRECLPDVQTTLTDFIAADPTPFLRNTCGPDNRWNIMP